VSVQDVCITYRTTFEKRPTLKDAVVRLGRGERAVREVEAVKNVSFDVKQGSVLGIVGSNGAGKSTLVRAIAGILPPTSGRIEVRGKVSTLLALGVGFNGAMSGQENVMLGGLAAGYTRAEVNEKYQEIADFAELGDFMELPMRTYSSGMFSRLAFAVAVHMEPDILLVDEALSAGDAKFREKATAKMNALVAEARTMILVSHALGTVKEMCNDAIWLNKGKLMLRGEPNDVVAEYTRFVNVGESVYTLEEM
jgi:lipopolysaccharide transport system ATP-binding protein/teichoic acid transport system ATP-binding protein